MEETLLELAVVLVLVVLNGVFALSELAVVSARRPRLRAMAEAGQPGAKAALAGAFSGAALGGRLAVWLVGLGVPSGVADPLGLGAVVALVTYLSIVVGE